MFHCMGIAHAVYPFIHWWTSGLFSLFGYLEYCCHDHLCAHFVWTQVCKLGSIREYADEAALCIFLLQWFLEKLSRHWGQRSWDSRDVKSQAGPAVCLPSLNVMPGTCPVLQWLIPSIIAGCRGTSWLQLRTRSCLFPLWQVTSSPWASGVLSGRWR